MMTYVQSAYKKPPKQNMAMTMRAANCASMARRDRIMRLSFKVTNTSLTKISKDCNLKWLKGYRGKSKIAIRARKSMPKSRNRKSVDVLVPHIQSRIS